MPRRGERCYTVIDVAPRVVAADRIGVYAVEALSTRGVARTIRFAGARFRCSQLVSELADEWIDYVEASRIGETQARAYVRGIRAFCAAADEVLADAAPAASLGSDQPNLVGLFAQWERTLAAAHRPGSWAPAEYASAVRTLIGRRAQHGARPVTAAMAHLVTGAIGVERGATRELDEFCRADKRTLVRTAWAWVSTVEKRLASGWDLAAGGAHPARCGWTSIPNLLWGLANQEISPHDIRANLPAFGHWPAELRSCVEHDGRQVTGCWASYKLVRWLVQQLYPDDIDLHAFRVLLVAATGHAPEEITALAVDDVEFFPGGVRLRLTKKRAGTVRPRAFRDLSGTAEDEDGGVAEFADRPHREVSAIIRRLLDVTRQTRLRARDRDGRLFMTGSVSNIYQVRFDRWHPQRTLGRFQMWITAAGITVDGAPDIRRLRKSTKVEKAIAFGGRIADSADDHHEETFRGHYAQGTTLRVLSGQVITTAQEHWLDQAVEGPTVLAEEPGEALSDPDQAGALGLTSQQADDIRRGALDMGLTQCRDPYDSPYSPRGHLCAVAPLRCLECRNAWILPSHLPQLLLFADHLDRLRNQLAPSTSPRYGAKATPIFTRCSPSAPSRRRPWPASTSLMARPGCTCPAPVSARGVRRVSLQRPTSPDASVFRHDEPVIQTHPLLPTAVVPVFGNADRWDLNAVLRRPANRSPAAWRIVFSGAVTEPPWNLLAREVCMIRLNPRHPAITASGVCLKPAPAHPSTVMKELSHLRQMGRWAAAEGMPAVVAVWGEAELRRFIDAMAADRDPETVVGYVELLKLLHRLSPTLSGGGLVVNPWPALSARRAAKEPGRWEIATPVIPPGQWFPLVRAAWTYVHTFGPDILRASLRHDTLRGNAVSTFHDVDERLDQWLAEPATQVPTHAAADPANRGRGEVPNWSLLALCLGMAAGDGDRIFAGCNAGGQRRRATVRRAIAAGKPTTTGLIDDLAQVKRADGTMGPWHPGLNPYALKGERIVLRDACFVLVVALSMMRDSEIHAITRGSVVEHYGSPAVVSTKQKHDPNLPAKHWWITEPVAEAIATAGQISSHPERVFAALHQPHAQENVQADRMLDAFIAHVNTTSGWTGLAPVPTERARPHMFRRTMAMLTDQFAGSEIALGIQLKHIATRALANRCTQGYATADPAWAEHLDSAIEAARFRRIEDLYQAHKAGEPVGYGPGAQRIARDFDRVQQTVTARGGDATVERSLLRQAGISIRFGTLNHCAFDERNPTGAVCLDKAIVPPGHRGPLRDRCRPDRCANSVIGPEHLPIWDSEKRNLLTLIDTPGLPACRQTALRRELTDVEAVLHKASQRQQ